MSTSANPKPKRRRRGPPNQGPASPVVATVGAKVAHEVGGEGARRDARQAPPPARVVATTARGRGSGEEGARGVEGSASNAGRSAHEAGGVDGSYLTQTRFDQCAISPLSLKAVKDAGYERMTQVQEATLPIILQGKDVLAKAKTGTGKTVGFLLPAIEVLTALPRSTSINLLVMCPTRELANQVAAEARKLLKYHRSLGVQVVIGGTRLPQEQRSMQANPCQILVATPGRLKDHLENTPGFSTRIKGVKVLVLDEADRLLDMGFRRDIEKIIAFIPKERQTLLFSATVPEEVRQISHVAMRKDYEFINTVQEGDEDGQPPPARSHTPSAMSLRPRPEAGSTAEGDEEQRLRAALRHLQAEAGVLERLVYKHRNQHRGAAYFQYLLKVGRDLKLLLGAGIAEVLNAVFPVLACRKPANTVLVPTKQTKKKPGANHSHHERLLGVARLLSQMAEPVMKAATQITFLLARSFFIDLCTAVLSLLARIRVLVQQMLLDVVSLYNKVTDLTDRKQAVKISIGGVQAFREYYPSTNDACTILDCVWVKDKFVLHEKMKGSCQETQVEDQKSFGPESSIQYETLALISEDTPNFEETNQTAKQAGAAAADQPDKMNHCSDAGGSQSGRQLENESGACSVPDTLSTRIHSVPHLNLKHETRKRVAFVAVGNPKVPGAASETKSSEVNKKQRLDMISQTSVESGL